MASNIFFVNISNNLLNDIDSEDLAAICYLRNLKNI